MKPAMSEVDIAWALQKRHSRLLGWTFLTQVRSKCEREGKGGRVADAIAFSSFPKRGLYAQGYEIKLCVSDLMSEVKNPLKSMLAKYCRYWYIAAPAGVISPSILPESWGLVEVTEKGSLRWSKIAAENTAVEQPTWSFVCSLLARTVVLSKTKKRYGIPNSLHEFWDESDCVDDKAVAQ